MGWHFSNALLKDFGKLPSSRALAAVFSGASCSDGEPSAPSLRQRTSSGCGCARMESFKQMTTTAVRSGLSDEAKCPRPGHPRKESNVDETGAPGVCIGEAAKNDRLPGNLNATNDMEPVAP